MSDYVPGWAFDPTLPRLPEGDPRCDRCLRPLTDIAAGGVLPTHHRVRATTRARLCTRSRDDLMIIVYRMQRDAAGLEPPANPLGLWWDTRRRRPKLVATLQPHHQFRA